MRQGERVPRLYALPLASKYAQLLLPPAIIIAQYRKRAQGL